MRITPLTDADAGQMVRSLATFPLLDGYRGASRADVGALEDVLLRVSAMVEAHPQIAETDLNPVIVLPEGAVIVDAPGPPDEYGSRGPVVLSVRRQVLRATWGVYTDINFQTWKVVYRERRLGEAWTPIEDVSIAGNQASAAGVGFAGKTVVLYTGWEDDGEGEGCCAIARSRTRSP